MQEPFLKDDAFLADVSAARSQPGLHLWWLGQSGFLVQYQGAHLLIDPYLSDALTRKYAGTDKPHVRLTTRVVDPARLDFIAAVTSSHNHTDHLDGETLAALLAANPGLAVCVPPANLEFAAQRLQVAPLRLTTLGVDAPLTIGPFTLHGLPAAHENLEQDEHGNYRYQGLVVQVGPFAFYHSGDCVPFATLPGLLRRWSLDLALLPINGRDPQRGVPGNFTGPEAARLAHDTAARLVIPMHYDMFAFNTVTPAQFEAEAHQLRQPYRILKNGERYTVVGR